MKFVSKDNLSYFTDKLKAWIKSRKIKASDLDSGSATAGQVFTADGSGGGSYQTPQAGTTVVANPTLAGTEAALSGLQVDNTKYGMPYLPLSGGTMTGAIRANDGDVLKDSQNDYIIFDRATDAQTYIGGSTLAKDLILRTGAGKHLYHRVNNTTNYEILDTGNTSANPTLAGTEAALESLKINGTSYKNQPSSMQVLTTAPSAANNDGIKIVVLSSEPSTKYNGYLYLITGA